MSIHAVCRALFFGIIFLSRKAVLPLKRVIISRACSVRKVMNENQIVVYQPNETVRLDVRLENETVWLTQKLIVIDAYPGVATLDMLAKRGRGVKIELVTHSNGELEESDFEAFGAQCGDASLKDVELNEREAA